MKSKFFKKVTSVFLAAVICLSNFIGIGSITAFAAENTTDEVVMIAFPREGDENFSGAWGHNGLRFMNGWYEDKVTRETIYTIGSWTGNVCYCIEIDGKVFSFLTDLGEITPTAAKFIRKANYLILEANYDDEMLRMGTYPQYLKERITSRTGHMSNIATAEFLAENITEDLKYIWLCHLSKDNNHPELAYKTVEWKLKSKGILVGKDVQLCALKRSTPSDLYEFD